MSSFLQFPQKPQDPQSAPQASTDKYSYLKSLVRYSFWMGLIFAFVFGVAFVFFLKKNPSHQLIDLRGRNIIEVIQWLNQHSLRVIISEKIDIQVPRYHIISQNPAPGDTVKENRIVTLTVSSGQQALNMPSYVGSNYSQAYNDLFAQFSGYQIIPQVTKIEKFSDIEAGLVIDHYPRYEQSIDLEEEIIFIVSKGISTGPIQVVDYSTSNFIEVEEEMLAKGIKVEVNYLFTRDRNLSGKIVFQNQTNGTILNQGDNIQFTVGIFSRSEQIDNKVIDKIEILRTYQLTVPKLSGLDSFKENLLTNTQEVLYSTNTQNAIIINNQRQVKIVLSDSLGERVLIDDVYYFEENIYLPYKTVGNARLKVFLDGELFEELLLSK